MNIIDIIEKKANGLELTKSEIEYAVMGYVNGDIPDYQISSLLMAIKLKSMNEKETWNLTEIMLNSGDKLHFDFATVDKHSTGGVGDKTTLVLVPLVSALGTKTMKMSGRGLGHTGGTIDKLEAIENFKTNLSIEEVNKQMKEIGACIVGQTGNLCPADKKLYALRDVTGTVSSIPLIASSIMSKKLASGADKIVIDLKVGNGALMNNIEDARKLANLMVKIGKLSGKEVVVVLTNMSQPLGYAVGNSLEVKEAIDTLKGNGPKDLEELVINLGALMISLDQKIPMEIALEDVNGALKNGVAYEKFKEIVKYQGGNIDKIPISSNVISVTSKTDGYIKSINALGIGEVAKKLGAGRFKKDDILDESVGIVLTKKVGDKVNKDEPIAYIYENNIKISVKEVLDCFEIDEVETLKPTLIYEIIK